jgi:hypothetical protein
MKSTLNIYIPEKPVTAFFTGAGHRALIFCAFIMIFSFNTGFSADVPAKTYGDFTASAGDYSVHFSAKHACQIDGIMFKGKILGQSNGNYGFAYHGGDMKFIGGTHIDMSIKEKVLAASLTVDGKEITPPADDIINGRHIEFITTSKLHDITAVRKTIITADGIERRL